MGDQTGGMGAEVGVRKINKDGDVTDTSGSINTGASRVAWAIFFLMVILSGFGLWKVVELIPL